MKNFNTNIIFNDLHKTKLTLKLWIKYIRQSLSIFMILLPVATVTLLSVFLYQAENILSNQNIYLPKTVALNYINPLKAPTYSINAGDFIAKHHPNIKPDTKIPFKTYKEAIDFYTNNQVIRLVQNYKSYSKLILLLILTGSSYWGFRQYQKDSTNSKKALHKRGMHLLTQNQIIELTKNNPHVLSIGNIHIPTDVESKHLLVFGASGSGKSVLLSQFLNQINRFSHQFKDKRHYIITDVKPEFIGKFAKPDDFIFCPFDKRSVYWSIFEDIDDISDYDNLASILFEDPNAKDPFWGLAAASIFSDGLKYLDLHNMRTNKDILNFFKQTPDRLKDKINTLPQNLITSSQYINAPESNTLNSILATLTAGLKPFTHLKDTSSPENKPFSFKRYIREEYMRPDGTIPNLYLLIPSNKQRLMNPLLSLINDIMINEALTLPESQTCRLYFIIDEIGSLDKIKLLPDLVTKGRSYGISIIALTQDPGLLKERYGTKTMQSFLNNFGTQIVLRINDANTAKELADNFGVEERIEYKESLQLQQDGKINPSISKDSITESIIIASELQSLPPFTGYGKIIGFNPFRLTIPKHFFNNQKGVDHYVPIDKISINDFKRKSKVSSSISSPEHVLKRLKGGD